MGMRIGDQTDLNTLFGRLRHIDRSIAKLTAERLAIIARIDTLVNPDGTDHRKAQAALAGFSKCSAAQASGELELARKLAVLPEVQKALEEGSISTGQLSAVAMIASPGDETNAIQMANNTSHAALERAAQAKRRDQWERRQQAEKRRYLSIKPDQDGGTMTILGRGPWEQMQILKQHLDKYAHQLGRCSEGAKEPYSTRLFDALMIATGVNTVAAVNMAVAQAAATGATPRLGVAELARATTTAVMERPVFIDEDAEPFPDTTDGGASDTFADIVDQFRPPDSRAAPPVIVTRADTKIVVHYDAATATANYENGPPLDHARLGALLCDASIEVIHYQHGRPNGLVTTQRTANERQARYLAQRDGPCRMPGCPGIGHTHAHHYPEYNPNNPKTDVNELLNLCNYHHNRGHDGQFTITGNPEGTLNFTYPDGHQLISTTYKHPQRRAS